MSTKNEKIIAALIDAGAKRLVNQLGEELQRVVDSLECTSQHLDLFNSGVIVDIGHVKRCVLKRALKLINAQKSKGSDTKARDTNRRGGNNIL